MAALRLSRDEAAPMSTLDPLPPIASGWYGVQRLLTSAPPLPPHFCNRSHVPASLNTHPCRQYLRYKVMSLNDFALSFPQRLGADPAASFVCGLHLKFTPSSSPTISRALRTQNL
jgi:hypothetical protein